VPTSALTSWYSPSDNTQHIAYFADAGRHGYDVQDVSVIPGQGRHWTRRNASEDAGARIAQYASALTSWFSVSDNVQHIANIDEFGEIWDLYVNMKTNPGGPWSGYNVTDDAGAAMALPGALTSWYFPRDTTEHIAYLGLGIHALSRIPGKDTHWQDLPIF
jgi:hypothetical protein